MSIYCLWRSGEWKQKLVYRMLQGKCVLEWEWVCRWSYPCLDVPSSHLHGFDLTERERYSRYDRMPVPEPEFHFESTWWAVKNGARCATATWSKQKKVFRAVESFLTTSEQNRNHCYRIPNERTSQNPEIKPISRPFLIYTSTFITAFEYQYWPVYD